MDNFWTERQKQDIDFFNENVEKWVTDPLLYQKFVVISDKTVVKCCDAFDAALRYAATTFDAGEYIIQQVLSDDEIVSFLSPALA